MSLPEVLVDRHIVDAIGEADLRAACAQLWPVDCVVCGRPLGAEPPGLWVSSALPGYDLALCHPRCTPPYGERPTTLAGLSWRATAFVLDGTPMVLLNPSAERVRLDRTDNRWVVRPDLLYPGTGLKLSKPGFVPRMDVPLRLAPLRLTNARVEIRLGGETYSTDPNTQIAEAIRSHDGCLLIITHGVWPDRALHLHDVMGVLTSRQAAIGWAGMDSAADRALGDGLTAVADAVAANVSPPAPDGGHWLLRLEPGERAVVQLLASSPVLNDDEAQAWAIRHLPDEARPLPWLPWNTDPATRRWRTRDVLTATGYDVIAEAASVRLYRQLSSAERPDGGDDEEAFAWAGRVLGRVAEWAELSPTGRIRWFTEALR